jgi:hypothetical protein
LIAEAHRRFVSGKRPVQAVLHRKPSLDGGGTAILRRAAEFYGV